MNLNTRISLGPAEYMGKRQRQSECLSVWLAGGADYKNLQVVSKSDVGRRCPINYIYAVATNYTHMARIYMYICVMCVCVNV